MSKVKQISFRISEKTFKKLKLITVLDDTSQQDILTELVENFVEDREKKDKNIITIGQGE